MNSLQNRLSLWWVILLAAVAYSILTGIAWNRYPAVWVDEGWVAEPAWVHAHGAPLGNPSHGDLHQFDHRLYWMPHLQFQTLSGLYRTGLPPLAGGRALSFGAGLLTLLVLLGWGRSILSQAGGGLSQTDRRGVPLPALLLWLAALFTLAPMMWKVHRTVRFESLLGLWTVLAVAVAWDPRRRWRGPVAGLAAGLALLTHPAGALAAGGTAVVLVLRREDARGAVRDLAWALLVLAALSLPTLAYFLEDRGNGFANVLGQNVPHIKDRAATVLARFAEEPHRYLSFFAWPKLALPLGAWVLAVVLAVRERAPRALLAVVFLFALGLALLPNKTELYLTLLAPFLYLLAAWVGARRRNGWIVGLGLLWVLNLAAADAALLWRNRDCRYEEWAEALAAPVPPGAAVGGTFLTWFVFHDHPYLEVHRRRAGDLYDGRPDYLVWGDHHLQDPLFERLRMELDPFLAEHAEVVTVSSSSCYGDAVLYRPRWEEADPREAAQWERYGEETQVER